ncbi:TraR/DksA family transcriptional regulator [Pseudenhygromyxa sp. WMMC2535]|uniref:TraR/DksA C4-type zinc finger protein n=1 Tax=Pseudenhygromyxa sp. WMMC2535 TaxID=2712867 RepID=UPI0015571343|nr:TraR/DksA family transcriptional regulator [Pseudenhygromyxa sp. WMMC2535]
MITSQAHPDLTPEDTSRLEAKLQAERATILARSQARSSEALAEQLKLPDEFDQASVHSSQTLELKLAGKDRKLLVLIDHALGKIRRGEYGLCEGTDEPIELRRLEARPWARYSLAYKEQLELERSMHVD